MSGKFTAGLFLTRVSHWNLSKNTVPGRCYEFNNSSFWHDALLMHTSSSTVRPIMTSSYNNYLLALQSVLRYKEWKEKKKQKKNFTWKTQYKWGYKSEVRAYYLQNIAEVFRRYEAHQLRPDIYRGKENLHFEGQSGQVSWLPFKTEKCV